MTEDVKCKLRESGLSKEMKSLENCDFLAIIEHNGRIIGAGGVGGFFHVPSLQIHPDFMKKGLGGKLFGMVIEEAKRRKYPFLLGSRNPQNINAVRLHDFFSLKPVIQVQYRPDFIRDVILLEFSFSGRILKKFLRIFNNIIGMTVLIIAIKIFKKTLFRVLLTYPPEEFPDPDIRYAIKNFKKIH